MKGWKNTTFNVPWTLNKVTNLGGSKHDKNKQEWEKTRTFMPPASSPCTRGKLRPALSDCMQMAPSHTRRILTKPPQTLS